MDTAKIVAALRALRLLERIPADQLPTLAGYLKPQSFADGALIFEEGSPGDSLMLIYEGHVRVSKRVAADRGGQDVKDLAILGPGECLGEMAIIDPGPRSARATAQGTVDLFVLERADLNRWLTANPALMVGFFAELVHVLTRRLRRSSNELALIFDLTQWLLEPIPSGKDLLQKVLGHLVPHIEGSWVGAAFLYNEFNREWDCVATEGAFKPPEAVPDFAGKKTLWLAPRTVAAAVPGHQRLEGYLVLQTPSEPAPEVKTEIDRTLATAAGLIHSALENIRFRTEDQLRARLSIARTYGTL